MTARGRDGTPPATGGAAPDRAAAPVGCGPPSRKHLVPLLKVGVWIGALVPLALLGWGLAGGFHVDDPVEEIQRRTGIAILVLLLLTLSITPLRRLSGWNPLIRFRRLVGNFAYFYATLHAFSYFVFDQELSAGAIVLDLSLKVVERLASKPLQYFAGMVTVGEEEVKLYIPPPKSAIFPEKVQLLTVGEEEWLNIPPPRLRRTAMDSTVMVVAILPLPPFIVKPSSSVAAASETDSTTW